MSDTRKIEKMVKNLLGLKNKRMSPPLIGAPRRSIGGPSIGGCIGL